MKVAVLGAGAWGTALAVTLAPRHETRLWVRDGQQLAQMQRDRVNQRYLRDIPLPENLRLVGEPTTALSGCDVAILGVTVAALRATLRIVAASAESTAVIWLCKGFEAASSRLPHQVAAEELPASISRGALSGPSFAQEIARGVPAAVTLAAAEPVFAAAMARELHSPRLRIYSSDDLTGVEVGGAVKNVIAIASGVSDGLRFGESARAALITRGLAEITRLGVKLGGRLETFMGLAGLGDLVLTCTSSLSRNRQVGLRLATGKPLATILQELGHVAEGVHTAAEVLKLGQRLGVDTPISEAVCKMLHEGLAPQAAVELLLARDPKPEHRA